MKNIKDAIFIRQNADFGDVRPLFFKEFRIDKPILKATLACSALGYYEAFLNGSRVGEFVFAPGWTSFAFRLQYQEYDVTALLKEHNTLNIALGNGRRFHGNPYEHYESITDKDDALIAALFIEYTDKTYEFIPTNSSWQCTKSNILYSNVYNGETVDFNTQTNEKFPVKELKDIDTKILIPTEGEEVHEKIRLSVLHVLTTPKGETVLDFGQNLTGYVEWRVPTEKGKCFKLIHGEVLDKDGNFYNENMRSAKVTVCAVSDGKEHTYKPHFSYQGFRYVKLEGFNKAQVNPSNFTAIAVFSDMKRTGYFECGHALVQQLYENTLWGQRDNFLDIPTDCNQRDERFGWVGDAQVFARTASLHYNTAKFFKKWLHDLAAEQGSDGCVFDVVPAGLKPHRGGSSAWGDAAVIVPYWLYRTYGDTQIIKDQFQSMKNWIAFMESHGSEYGLFDLWDHHFGDWLSLDAGDEARGGMTDKNLIATAYLAYCSGIFAQMGKAIGEDVTDFERLHKAAVKKYAENYLNTGKPEHETQTANTLAIYFDLTDNPLREGKKLAKDIEECGHLKTGFVGTPYLLHALTKIGRSDLAYKLLLKGTFPSWLYPITKGATTIWERWDGIKSDGSFATPTMNSFNHYAYGSVCDWIYTTVGGIDSDINEPGFKHIIFKPIPNKALKYTKTRILTDNGEIVSFWEYSKNENEYRFLFTVPNGSHATLYLGNKIYELKSGTHTAVLKCEN